MNTFVEVVLTYCFNLTVFFVALSQYTWLHLEVIYVHVILNVLNQKFDAEIQLLNIHLCWCFISPL